MIFVTAGHVDHGKTSLLRALTGTDTTHLPEEKKRGLTIDLGYAYLPTEQGVLGFIDVPGHQRFLSNMLAGLGGVDYALLIISAEEGIKPQTVEHFTILQRLDFKQISVIITKADRVDDTQCQTLITQIKTRFTPLADAPFFITSAHSLQGIESLKQHLIGLSRQQIQTEACAQPFRYAIDRVFTVKGAGLVVTGTAIAGRVTVGDTLWLSNGESVRVKQIHAQNTPAEQGYAGQRLALNLAYNEKMPLQRGDWLSALAPHFATDRISVTLNAPQPLAENSVVHLYHFASHTTGKLNLLESQTEQGTLAEIILDNPLNIACRDRLIIRNGDDSQTLAGARVLEIHSPKRHKRSDKRLDYLKNLQKADNLAQQCRLLLAEKAYARDFLCWALQCHDSALQQQGHCRGKWIFSDALKQHLTQTLLEKLADYHQQHPDQLGVTKARLQRISAPTQPESVIFTLIDELLTAQQLKQTRGWLHLPEHKIELNAAEAQLWAQIQPLFAATHQALWVRDIATEFAVEENEMRNLLYKIGKLGYLVPIVKDRFLSFEQISQFARLIKAFIAEHGEISVNQLRDEIGYGRKLTVQLIEYFDRVGLLRRKGNVHLLRDSETY